MAALGQRFLPGHARGAWSLRSASSASCASLPHAMRVARFSTGHEVLPECGVLGPQHSFTCLAWQEFVRRLGLVANTDGLPTRSFTTSKELARALQERQLPMGVFPVEDSYSGAVSSCVDDIINADLVVLGEVSTVESHCLAAPKGTVTLANVRYVHSHPTLLRRCSDFLQQLHTDHPAQLVSCSTSSAAAHMVAGRTIEGEAPVEVGSAAICSDKAAEYLGLEVLAKGVANDANSQTRYIIATHASLIVDKLLPQGTPPVVDEATAALQGQLARIRRAGLTSKQSRAQSSAVFALRNTPGALVHALSCLAFRQLQITSLNMRPVSAITPTLSPTHAPILVPALASAERPHWHYMLVVEWESGSPDVELAALSAMQSFTTWLRPLGSRYPSLRSRFVYQKPQWAEEWEAAKGVMHR